MDVPWLRRPTTHPKRAPRPRPTGPPTATGPSRPARCQPHRSSSYPTTRSSPSRSTTDRTDRPTRSSPRRTDRPTRSSSHPPSPSYGCQPPHHPWRGPAHRPPPTVTQDQAGAFAASQATIANTGSPIVHPDCFVDTAASSIKRTHNANDFMTVVKAIHVALATVIGRPTDAHHAYVTVFQAFCLSNPSAAADPFLFADSLANHTPGLPPSSTAPSSA